MRKTLLLCFIHGFKGGEDTFGSRSEFAEHLAALLSAALPRVDVRAVTYPKYETRGDLAGCVARFRDWLTEAVIDLEVGLGTSSPTVDPGVRVVLVGHSMGGIVAAETAIALATDRPIKAGGDNKEDEEEDEEKDEGAAGMKINSLMFPYVQGVLAFDTPFLGISPGVVAHKAEGHYQTAAAALTQLSALSGMWGGSKEAAGTTTTAGQKPMAAIEAAPSQSRGQSSNEKNKNNTTNNANSWASWGKIAMMAGAAGAVAAGGAAAYLKREQLSEGWGWATSHLEFVGCLARREELRNRVRRLGRLRRELPGGFGFANLYTRLGAGAGRKEVPSVVGTVMGKERTFCNLPPRARAKAEGQKGEGGQKEGQQQLVGGGGDDVWLEAVNDKAADETTAHMTMFESAENPGYGRLSEDATRLIVQWVATNEWYETSSAELGGVEESLN